MVQDILVRGWENFIARPTGPLSFRFFMQPAVAIFLGIRAGLKHHEGWREALQDVGKVIVLAAIFDSVYQIIAHRGIYFLELAFTVTVLAIVPYLLVRGPVSFMATSWEHHHHHHDARRV